MKALVVLSCVAVTMAATSTAVASGKKVYTHDFITATKIVGHYYGSNVEKWLVSCSSGEGGHGGWVWYRHDRVPRYGYTRTPGGWMQFMGGTFDSNVGWAFRDAQQRGLRVHPKARNYYEPLGQAIVAAAMYRYHGNPGTWTGAGC